MRVKQADVNIFSAEALTCKGQQGPRTKNEQEDQKHEGKEEELQEQSELLHKLQLMKKAYNLL